MPTDNDTIQSLASRKSFKSPETRENIKSQHEHSRHIRVPRNFSHTKKEKHSPKK